MKHEYVKQLEVAVLAGKRFLEANEAAALAGLRFGMKPEEAELLQVPPVTAEDCIAAAMKSREARDAFHESLDVLDLPEGD